MAKASKKKTNFVINFIKKYLFPIIFLILISYILFYSLSALKNPIKIEDKQAIEEQGPTLSMSPGAIGTRPGESFNINFLIDTKLEKITAADITISYDPNILKAETVTKGTLLPVALKSAAISNGVIKIILGSNPTAPFTGNGALFTVHFSTLSEGNTIISYTSASQIAAISQSINVLSATTGSIITVTYPLSPTAIPTLIPSSIPTSAPTLTPLPTSTPPSLTPTPVVSILKIYTAGTQVRGVYPNMKLLVNNQTVLQAYNVTGNSSLRIFKEYVYTSSAKLSPDQIKIQFTNDAIDKKTRDDRNLQVDRINIDGVDYQTEDENVFSSYNRKYCPSGNLKIEWLYCNGELRY